MKLVIYLLENASLFVEEDLVPKVQHAQPKIIGNIANVIHHLLEMDEHIAPKVGKH